MALLELMQELLQRLSNDGAGADFSRTVLMLAAKCRSVRFLRSPFARKSSALGVSE